MTRKLPHHSKVFDLFCMCKLAYAQQQQIKHYHQGSSPSLQDVGNVVLPTLALATEHHHNSWFYSSVRATGGGGGGRRRSSADEAGVGAE